MDLKTRDQLLSRLGQDEKLKSSEHELTRFPTEGTTMWETTKGEWNDMHTPLSLGIWHMNGKISFTYYRLGEWRATKLLMCREAHFIPFSLSVSGPALVT